MAFFEAEGGGDVGVGEDAFEAETVLIRGAGPLEALDGVVGNEVDLGADGGGALGEDLGVLGVGVDTIDEDVFEGDLLVLL